MALLFRRIHQKKTYRAVVKILKTLGILPRRKYTKKATPKAQPERRASVLQYKAPSQMSIFELIAYPA